MVMVFSVITKRERYKWQKMHNTGKKTKGLLIVTLVIWAIFSMGIFLFGAEMNSVTGPFGYPLTYWFTCQGSLGIFVILIFWFAGRQEKIDEEFGFSEKGDN
jgi:putative solute:sodium symporter small subunit